jgi:hypothetical protein
MGLCCAATGATAWACGVGAGGVGAEGVGRMSVRGEDLRRSPQADVSLLQSLVASGASDKLETLAAASLRGDALARPRTGDAPCRPLAVVASQPRASRVVAGVLRHYALASRSGRSCILIGLHGGDPIARPLRTLSFCWTCG